MNLDLLKKNVGTFVQLEPFACRLDEHGFELPARNDDWFIRQVTRDGAEVSNVATGHSLMLAPDHIHHYTSNGPRSTATQKHGFLTLLVQLFIQGVNVSLRPTPRPGERLAPTPVAFQEKAVDFRYPADSGLQAMQAALGYRLLWSNESDVARRVDLEGYEVVRVRDRAGVLNSFRLRTRPHDQILLRRFAPEGSLTSEEWAALKGIASAATLGIQTATRPVTSARLLEWRLVGFDEAGRLMLTDKGRDLLDRRDAPSKALKKAE